MKRKNKASLRAKKMLAGFLQVQKSAVGAGLFANIYENEEITVDGFDGILEYSSETLVLSSPLFIMHICGKNLEICTVSSESIRIKGKICEVKYDMYN